MSNWLSDLYKGWQIPGNVPAEKKRMCIKLKKSATKNHEILLSDFFGEYSLDKTQAFEYKLARLKDG